MSDPIEPAQSIEKLRDAHHFINIIDRFERQNSETSRVIVPLFDTVQDKFKFVLNYLCIYSTHPINEWNKNDLANDNIDLLGKVSLLIIYAFRRDLSYSAALADHYIHRIGRINDLLQLHALNGYSLPYETETNYNELKKINENLQQCLEQCQKENSEMKEIITKLEKEIREKEIKNIALLPTADTDQGGVNTFDSIFI